MKDKLKDFFSRDRKTLYMILSIVLISIFSLTIVYAALSATLNIQGNAEVVASSWDIHLDNVKVTSGSVSGTTPTITSPTTATFSTNLTTPGDFYEFTVDVVNDGSIDAMIDRVTKTPTLTTAQAKYLNYIIEYQNGESIITKQLVSKNSYVRLKVRVEFRKDITASDLPTTSETLNLSFTVNYIQSDGTGSSVTDNGVYFLDTIEPQGNVGADGSVVYYYYDETTTTLHIWGEGNMINFASNKGYPWYSEIIFITKIKIYEGIQLIGTSAFRGGTSINEIIYEGTMEQWNAIRKGNSWNSGIRTTLVICSDGVVSLT